MWIEDIEGNLINLANAAKVVVSNQTLDGVDPEPVWWCAVVFEKTPKPGILYAGSEANAKKARSAVRDRISLESGNLVTRRIFFEGEEGDPLAGVDLKGMLDEVYGGGMTKDDLFERLREVGRS